MTNKVKQKKKGIREEKSGNNTNYGILFKGACLKEHGEGEENNRRTGEKYGQYTEGSDVELEVTDIPVFDDVFFAFGADEPLLA